jgi:superfamily II DNA or RNA helicase
MDDGHVTPLKIQAIVLRHPEELRKFHKGMKYTEEINFIISSEQRNKFISRLALSCSGNTLILYNFVEKHGSVIYEDLIRRNTDPDRKIYFIHGAVATKEREIIRKIVEIESNAIIVATASLFSTGTNIPSLENIIFAIPTKSTIRVRQSIGRGLRLKSGKKWCTLYDISDDITYKNYRNTTLKHLAERIRIYDKEQFDYKIVKIDL